MRSAHLLSRSSVTVVMVERGDLDGRAEVSRSVALVVCVGVVRGRSMAKLSRVGSAGQNHNSRVTETEFRLLLNNFLGFEPFHNSRIRLYFDLYFTKTYLIQSRNNNTTSKAVKGLVIAADTSTNVCTLPSRL